MWYYLPLYLTHLSYKCARACLCTCVTNLLFVARAWPHFLRACCWTLYSCSLSYIWNTCQWGHMQQDTGFAITPDDLIHEGDSPLLIATTNIGTCIQKPQESDNCYLLMFLLHSLKQFQCLTPSGNMPASILHPWKLESKFWCLGQWAFITQLCCAWAVFLSRMLYIPLARTELLSSHIPTKIGGLQWLVAEWWSLVAILVGSKNRDTCNFQQ